jgi:predicted PurR-regulated permease PerM
LHKLPNTEPGDTILMIAQTPLGATPPPTTDIFTLARLALTLAFLIATLLLISPFTASLTWALVLSVIFLRPHALIEKWTGPNIGAAISVFLIALIIVAPLSFASKRLIVEAMSGFSYLQNALAENKWQTFIAAHPAIDRPAGDPAARFLHAVFLPARSQDRRRGAATPVALLRQ